MVRTWNWRDRWTCICKFWTAPKTACRPPPRETQQETECPGQSDALVRRVEVAQRIGAKAAATIDARSLAEKLYPGSLSEVTRTAIARAESPAEGLALLLVSPEFVRR